MAMPQTTIVFDTHEAVHQLTAAGVPERQAEAHVRLQAQLIEQNFATTADIEALRRDTKGDIKALTLTIEAVAAELRTDMGKLETQMAKVEATVANKLTDHFRWLIGAQLALAAIILAALKLF